jgi:SPP1 gp7 family putative phage head morphogenesis protein
MRLTKAQAKSLLPHVLAAIELFKSSGAGTARAFRLLAQIRERHDGNFEDVFGGWLGDVKDALASIDASDRAEFIKAIADAFDTDPLLKAYSGALDSFLADYQRSFERDISIKTDWDKANTSAVDVLTSSISTNFGRFAQEQQDRISGILADGLAAGDPTPKIAAALANGMNAIEYTDEDGNVFRTLEPDVWATQVARTESNRAYAQATRDALEGAGVATWQWIAASDERCCDECDGNDGAIVNIGDDFPSGDSEPPAHANCRCIVTAVESELTGSADDSEA